jgi:soluble lytic murein transglycosylase
LAALTRDPDYNIMLGSRYFEQLMGYWGGNAPLAVASYNAGMGNVRKWINEYRRSAHVRRRRRPLDRGYPVHRDPGLRAARAENAVVYDAINPSQAARAGATRLSYYLGKSGRPG